MEDKSLRANLMSGLVDYWPLTEQSGTRSSLFGKNTLTNNNTVTGNPGLFGMASQFTAANSESLSIADNAALSISGNPFTVSGWVYADSFPGLANTVFAKRANAGTGEYSVAIDSGTGQFVFYNPQSTIQVNATNFGVPSTLTWLLVVVSWDVKNMSISINATTPNSASGGTFADTAALFSIGAQQTTPTFFWDGRICHVGFWKRALNTQEIQYIYNNGLGRPLFLP